MTVLRRGPLSSSGRHRLASLPGAALEKTCSEPCRLTTYAMSEMRSYFRLLSGALLVAGALLVLDAVSTVLWQEPVTAVRNVIAQRQLAGDLSETTRSLGAVDIPAVLKRASPRRRSAFLARRLRRALADGDALGTISARAIGLDARMVEGVSPSALRRGPGHYPDTALPGERGTVALAGHRTTYGAPFRRLDDLEPGARISLELPHGRWTYKVERTRIVPPTATWVTRRVGYDHLVLTACHPLYSATHRIVVFARLVGASDRRSQAVAAGSVSVSVSVSQP